MKLKWFFRTCQHFHRISRNYPGHCPGAAATYWYIRDCLHNAVLGNSSLYHRKRRGLRRDILPAVKRNVARVSVLCAFFSIYTRRIATLMSRGIRKVCPSVCRFVHPRVSALSAVTERISPQAQKQYSVIQDRQETSEYPTRQGGAGRNHVRVRVRL